MSAVLITRAGPLATIQDRGRFGTLRHGISASGAMDNTAFVQGAMMLGEAGSSAIECTRAGLGFSVEGEALRTAFTGGEFTLTVNGAALEWPGCYALRANDHVEITPGPSGNYGYVRFEREIDVPPVLGSRSTNIVSGLGGFGGRGLQPGDWVWLTPPTERPAGAPRRTAPDGPIRVVWGLHADGFDAEARLHFTGSAFEISGQLNRMGVRLTDRGQGFRRHSALSLVSDAIVPGDIQILGDGTPIVLMRDHQVTGGYPRIATVIAADFDRFAQLRPGQTVRFDPVTLKRARAALVESVR